MYTFREKMNSSNLMCLYVHILVISKRKKDGWMDGEMIDDR